MLFGTMHHFLSEEKVAGRVCSVIAFYSMCQVFGSFGRWEALIGGVLLIFTAITNPEGIAGGIRMQVAQKRQAKELAKQEKSALASA